LVNLFIYLSLLCTSGERISKIDRKSADRTPENDEEMEGSGGKDDHSNQLEEDSAQLSSSEASGSLFEVQKLLE
jgi:hypothetical protein